MSAGTPGAVLLVGLLVLAACLLGAAPSPATRLSARPRRRARRPRRGRTGGRGPRAHTPPALDLPLLLDLVAAASRSGAPAPDALDAVLGALPEQAAQGSCPSLAALRRVHARLALGAPAEAAWADVPAELEPLRGPVLLSAATGAPAADLLEAAAAQARRDGRRAAEVAAARLGALLVLPLGLCTLPAFVLLGVVPVLLSLAGDVLPGS
ncbi:hypothetical protein NUM3379_23250 [Kineococcus sp. NUM-3379]